MIYLSLSLPTDRQFMRPPSEHPLMCASKRAPDDRFASRGEEETNSNRGSW